MSATLPMLWRLPCCGRPSLMKATTELCFECALKVTAFDDPLAVAYRTRAARRKRKEEE